MIVRTMLLAAVAATAIVAASAAHAAPGLSPLTPKLGVTASTTHHSARNVKVVFAFAYLMRCGQPGPTPIVISLPTAAGVPATSASVLVNGKPTTMKVAGHTVTVATPQPPRIMCDLIGIGTTKVTLTGIRNPLRAGTYLFTAEHGTTKASAKLKIS